MKRSMKSIMLGSAAAVALFAATPAIAQETSSSLRGVVVDSSGNAVSSVSVEVTHVPSGTTRSVETNASGVFFLRGLKVGGPYLVKLADGSEYRADTIDDLNLALGQASNVTLIAATSSENLEEIVVTGQRAAGMTKTGAASQWGRDEIDLINNSDRDIKSILSTDPKIWIDPTNENALSIAGTNNRMNSLTIDGIKSNDDFGLNNNGYPTQRSPISLDAVEQLQVNTAPFEVTYGSFQGGNINIVTKSGTNEFHGGGFYEYSDQSMVGSKSQSNDLDVGDFKEKSYGVYLGGPILEDKLFFFTSYEKFDSTRPFEFGPEGSGAANEVDGVTQSDLDRVTSIASSVYGYDTLGFGGQDIKEKDEKILVKLDWNINDQHRASATYTRVDGNNVNPQNTSSFGDAGMLGHWYSKSEKLTTWSFQAFSDWTDNLSTEIKVGIKKQDTDQISLGGTEFSLMEIATEGGGAIFIGPDFFRHGNDLVNDAKTFKAKADYLMGDHLITFGYEMDDFEVFNLFNPGSRGSYEFDSIDDFEAQMANTLFYQNAYTNVIEDAGAEFAFKIHTFYLQDRWEPTPDLTIFAGLRYERMDGSDEPRLNDNFVDRNGFANTENLNGKDIILPRFGFNYAWDDRTTVRGGFGLFSGGSPNVWVSNSYSNDGTIIDSVFLGSWFADLSNIDGYNLPAAATGALEAGNGNVNAIHPQFKLPSVWKYNLAIERAMDLSFMGLGDDWFMEAEVIYGSVKDAVIWTETRRSVVGSAPDGRPIYDVPGGYDLILDNANQGKSQVITFNMRKAWETDYGNFNFRFGYANQDVTDVNPGQSSTASSNFGKVSTSDRNNMQLATSDHEIKHRFTAVVNWQKDFWEDNTTSIGLNWSTRSGRHYSYTFDDPGQRTGPWSTLDEVLSDPDTIFGGDRDFWRRDTQLLYIPEMNDPNVIFASVADEVQFNRWVERRGLEDMRGQILPRNSASSPWATRLDLHMSQEVPVPMMKDHKIKLSLDIDNFTNMLNKNWGRLEQQGFHYYSPVVRADLNEDGQYVYDFRGGFDTRLYTLPSLWKLRVGASYKF